MSVEAEPNRLSLAWSSLAVLLVVATVLGGGMGALLTWQWASVGPQVVRLKAHGKGVEAERSEAAVKAAAAAPMQIYLPVVAPQDIDSALDSMALTSGERRELRSELAGANRRLLWLTLWDWDTATESGDTISIAVDDYQRLFTLASHRTRIAIPEPRDGRMILRGERTEDGIIAISFLSGTRPIALPYMRGGRQRRARDELALTPAPLLRAMVQNLGAPA